MHPLLPAKIEIIDLKYNSFLSDSENIMLSEPEIVSLLSFSALVLVYMMTFLRPEKEDEELVLLIEQSMDGKRTEKKLRINPYLPFMSPIITSPFYYTKEKNYLISLHLDS